MANPSWKLMVVHLVDILLQSSAATRAYEVQRVAKMEDLGAVWLELYICTFSRYSLFVYSFRRICRCFSYQ